MKVLVLSQHYWPETFRITDVVRSLRERGIDVDVLTGQPNYPDGRVFSGYRAWHAGPSNHDGARVYRVPLVPRGHGGALRLALNYLSFVVSAGACGAWLLRRERYDVIFVYATSPILQALPALFIGRLKRARVVTWVQDLWPQSLEATGFVRNRHLLGAVAAVVRWIYARNDLLLVQSPAFVAPVRALAGDTPIAYHPNPGDSPLPTAASPALQLPPGFNIVFAGNLGTVQSLDTVLDAAERLRTHSQLRFTLVGSGSRVGWLREQIERRGLHNVDLPGRFPPDSMPALFAQASVLLVSLARSPIMSLTLPSKLQTYLAAGRPVIASLDGEGARLVREAGAGLACPAEDAAALADAVLTLSALPAAERERLGVNARRYFDRHFEPGCLAEQLERLLAGTTPQSPTIPSRMPCP